jgi:hypothetical protein
LGRVVAIDRACGPATYLGTRAPHNGWPPLANGGGLLAAVSRAG